MKNYSFMGYKKDDLKHYELIYAKDKRTAKIKAETLFKELKEIKDMEVYSLQKSETGAF